MEMTVQDSSGSAISTYGVTLGKYVFLLVFYPVLKISLPGFLPPPSSTPMDFMYLSYVFSFDTNAKRNGKTVILQSFFSIHWYLASGHVLKKLAQMNSCKTFL